MCDFNFLCVWWTDDWFMKPLFFWWAQCLWWSPAEETVSLRKRVDRLLAAALCVDSLILPRECSSVRAFTTDVDGLRNSVLHWWHRSTLSCVLHWGQYRTLFYTILCSTLRTMLYTGNSVLHCHVFYTEDNVLHCHVFYDSVLHWWGSELSQISHFLRETSERGGGACMGFPECADTILEQHGTELSFLPASGKMTVHKHYFLCAGAWMPESPKQHSSLNIPVCECSAPNVWCMLFALWLILLHVRVQEASMNYKTVVV